MNNQAIFQETADHFFSTLHKRINIYFSADGRSKKANTKVHIKTTLFLITYITPFVLILCLNLPIEIVYTMYFIMGLSIPVIGLAVMHDANHGAYSQNKLVNKLLGASIYLLGGNKFTWNVQHNLLHHTYTNIHELDEDISNKIVLRLSKNAKWRSMYKYQHVYAFFLYSLMTLSFVFKDFKQMYKYKKEGYFQLLKTSIVYEWFILIVTKALYIFVFLCLPLLLTSMSMTQIILGFLIMHFIAGLISSMIIQMAHVVEKSVNENENKDMSSKSWAQHQLVSSSNFAMHNKLLTWYSGALNYQIEHHLFPKICHIHYPNIAKIVKKTASEYNLPYNEYTTFSSALGAHINMLKTLGVKKSIYKAI